MRSESTALRDAAHGLCFAETSMRPLRVTFHPTDLAAAAAATTATAKVTRLHDLPDPVPPVPVVLRVPVG